MPRTIFQVHIKSNGRIRDGHCRKSLSKSAGDGVRWIASDGGPWTIRFVDGSPFRSSTFKNISPGNPAESGPAVGAVGKTYKYEVRNADGELTDDPDILIEP